MPCRSAGVFVIRVFVCACMVMIASSQAGARTPEDALGLADLLPAALRENPAVLSAQSAHNAAKLDLIDSYLGFAPRANWTFQNSRERLDVVSTKNYIYQKGISHFGTYENTLEVVQPLFDARIFAQLHGAYAGLHRARAELDSASQKALFELIQAYLSTLGSADSLALSQAEEATLAKQNDIMQARIGRGVGNVADADEITARLMQARSGVEGARANLAESFATLEHKAGVRVPAVWKLASPIPMPPPLPNSVEEWVQTARAQNPDVLTTDDAADEAYANYQTAAAAVLPRLELDFTQDSTDSGGSVYGGGDLTTERTVMFKLTVPLFNGDGNGYPAAAARARYHAAKYRSEDQRREIADRVHTAFDEVVANARRAKILGVGAQAAQRVVIAKEARFRSGMGDITDILDADRDFVQAQRQLLASRYNYLLNLLQLKRLAGDVSDADVAFIDACLERNGAPIERPEK